MKFAFCVACLATDDLQHHHLVPREEGGSDDEANLLTLCSSCGDKLQRQRNGTYKASGKRGLASATARGIALGHLTVPPRRAL
jgi:5-methylcytosine-specific restriction endonuclease McrA